MTTIYSYDHMNHYGRQDQLTGNVRCMPLSTWLSSIQICTAQMGYSVEH